jgi:DNA replication initiation complex subunit (GINS family)
MTSDFRSFVKSEYEKVVQKEKKAADDSVKGDLTNRQKGASKGLATKANNRFIDMLTKKVKDQSAEEPANQEPPENNEPNDQANQEPSDQQETKEEQ